MKGKIVLGNTYITTIGEFTPVMYERGKFKYPKGINHFWSDSKQRLDGRYIDANGRRLRRKYFIKHKSQTK